MHYRYLCPKQSSGKLVHYIGKDRSLNFEIVVATKDGKLAETEYKILRIYNHSKVYN